LPHDLIILFLDPEWKESIKEIPSDLQTVQQGHIAVITPKSLTTEIVFREFHRMLCCDGYMKGYHSVRD
jgi:hypothetical protein